MLLLSLPAFAAFEDTGTGARPTAMGGTYVVVGDDVQSLMYNPAGLAQMDRREVTSEYSKLYAGLTDGSNISQYFFGYGQRIKYGGTVAFGWKQLSLDNLYVERTLSMGYGEWITERVAAGFALKQLHHSFAIPNQIVDNSGNITAGTPDFFQRYGNSNSAYGIDIGVLARLTGRHTLGLSIQDVNEPNIALSNEYRRIVPRTTRIGLSYQVPEGALLSGALSMRQTFSNRTDYTWTGAAERPWILRSGAIVGLRGSLAKGSREFQQIATGPYYRTGGFQLDYTMVFNFSGISFGDTAGTHRFSLTYRFGAPPTAGGKPAPKPPFPSIDTNPPTLGPWLDSLSDLLENPLPKEEKPEAPKKVAAPVIPAIPESATPATPAPKPAEAVSGGSVEKPITVRPRAPEATATGGIPLTYIVKSGDTLESIARMFYGRAERWRDIYASNSDRLGLGGYLEPGQVLILPRQE